MNTIDKFHIKAATGWLELGNWKEASNELDKVAAKFQSHPAVLSVRYDICRKAGKTDLAVQIAQTLTELLPEKVEHWLAYAQALRDQSEINATKAKQILMAALCRFPQSTAIPYKLACYECLLGNLAQSKQWLERVFQDADAKRLKIMALEDPDLQKLWSEIGQL